MFFSARHAYLIMAHNNPEQLLKLLCALDDTRNDIYLHVDQKSVDMDASKFSNGVKFSKLFRVESIATNWGGASLVKAELNLLRSAVGGNYAYYHLISGADLPLKKQDQIHAFFQSHKGLEFIHFDPLDVSLSDVERVKYYFPLQEIIGRYRKYKLARRLLSGLANLLVQIQKLCRVNRLEPGLRIAKGAQWFSISHELASYIIQREDWIQRFIKCSLIPDEIFLQTLVLNSPFKERLYWGQFDNDYRACMRAIEWRPRIYTYRLGDFERLINSEFLFARKFDESIDSEIVARIIAYLSRA